MIKGATSALADYKFKSNMLKASESKTFEDALKEWRIIRKEKRDAKTGLCICQRKIKHITFVFNHKTKLSIMVGTRCCSNFKIEEKLLVNALYRHVLYSCLEKGEYEVIDNIVNYSKYVEDELNRIYSEKMERVVKASELRDIKNELGDLYTNYG